MGSSIKKLIRGQLSLTSSMLKGESCAHVAGFECLVIVPGDPGQQPAGGIVVEIVIVGHQTVGIPVLDDSVDRQPVEEAIHIKDGFQSRPPGFRVGGAGVGMQSLVKGLDIAVVGFILVGFLVKGCLVEGTGCKSGTAPCWVCRHCRCRHRIGSQ